MSIFTVVKRIHLILKVRNLNPRFMVALKQQNLLSQRHLRAILSHLLLVRATPVHLMQLSRMPIRTRHHPEPLTHQHPSLTQVGPRWQVEDIKVDLVYLAQAMVNRIPLILIISKLQ